VTGGATGILEAAVVALLAKIDGLADTVTMGCDNVIGMPVKP